MSVQPSSILTQVGYNVNPLTEVRRRVWQNTLKFNLRGTLFEISRHELLKLPETILLGISNGLMAENNMANLPQVEVPVVNFSPACLEYTLDVFRKIAAKFPPRVAPSEGEEYESPIDEDIVHEDLEQNSIDLKKTERAIIVLREDLDYYCLPIGRTVSDAEMQSVKKACGDLLVNQTNIFTGLRKGDEPGSAEQHLIGMLCSSGFSVNDNWGFRELEPHKTVISSLSLTKLVMQPLTDDMDEEARAEAMLPHKLLLFWRKPARKCWWDSVELNDVGDISGPVRVHIRRVWTLELSIVS